MISAERPEAQHYCSVTLHFIHCFNLHQKIYEILEFSARGYRATTARASAPPLDLDRAIGKVHRGKSILQEARDSSLQFDWPRCDIGII